MYDFLSHTTHDVSAEVYVADFGLARTKAVESRVATTKQSFGPIAVRTLLRCSCAIQHNTL